MTNAYFYRFRSASSLVGDRKELERQVIFLASPDALNDPMEGFKDVCWKGDAILWENLLSHYILCLLHTASVVALAGEHHVFKEGETFVFSTESTLPTRKAKLLFRTAKAKFFSHSDIGGLPALLATRPAVRRSELIFYLTCCHFHALNCVLSAMEEAHLTTMRPPDAGSRGFSGNLEQISRFVRNANEAEHKHPDQPDITEILSGIFVGLSDQVRLINAYGGSFASRGPAWRTIMVDFPVRHADTLERLMYNEWYTACFVSSAKHASMWGTYGDSHKGICLKFKSSPSQADNEPGLFLNRVAGQSASSQGIRPAIRDVWHQFHEVQYQDKFVEVNFFQSLGRLTRNHLLSWATDGKGNVSPLLKDLLSADDTWRQAYWTRFMSAVTTKTKHWEHEGEHRIVLHSSITDLSDPELRTVNYRFKDLQGLIFGIKTSLPDKISIIKVIEEKCRVESRSDFEFYQAYYSHSTGSIEAAPMNLLKFKEMDQPSVGGDLNPT